MRLLFLAFLFGACGVSEPISESISSVSNTQEAIVGGTITTGDPAVVVLMAQQGGLFEYCTGTLIGPKTVMTAAHCVNAYGPNVTYYAVEGDSSSTRRQSVRILSQTAHPNYTSREYDFGVLRLSAPMLNVTPIPLNEKPMTPFHVGLPIRHVGFGNTTAAMGGLGGGTKREVTYSLRTVASLRIESGANGKQTCQGDSGGPGFMVMPGDSQESLVGVVSYGDAQCLFEGWDGRVDAVAPWIRSTMAQWEQPTCSTDGACLPGCMPIDQDCACKRDGLCTADCFDVTTDLDCPFDCRSNGICSTQACPRKDNDCVADGSLCGAVQSCQGRICAPDNQHPEKYCSRGCTDNAQCDNGLVCIQAQCTYPQKPERQLFDVCDVATDFCVGGICTGPSGGFTRCVTGCASSSDCPSGSSCDVSADSSRFCRPQNLKFNNIVLPRVGEISQAVAEGCQSTSLTIVTAALLLLLRNRRQSR